jgi:hypothetical protein
MFDHLFHREVHGLEKRLKESLEAKKSIKDPSVKECLQRFDFVPSSAK